MAEVKLEACCQRTLKRMKQRMKSGRYLTGVLGGAQILTIFAGRGNLAQVPTAVNIANTDWDLFARAVGAVPRIARRAAAQDAGLHAFDHPTGELNKFWRDLYDSLS